MSEKRQITKRELLERVWVAAQGDTAPPMLLNRDLRSFSERLAGALGFTVIDEPELPERLTRSHPNGVLIFAEPHNSREDPIASSPSAEMAAELILRYNAKNTVMRVADRLRQAAEYKDGSRLWLYEKDFQEMDRQLRAAYEEEKP